MSKGGKTSTQTVQIDPDLKAQALKNIDLTDAVSQIGQIPYQGLTLAGFTPQQMASMKGLDQAAAAFGMPSAVDWQPTADGSGFLPPTGFDQDQIYTALTGMPPPTTNETGISGYSPFSQFEYEKGKIPQGQLDAILSFFMDPETGDPGTYGAQEGPKPIGTIDGVTYYEGQEEAYYRAKMGIEDRTIGQFSER